MVLVSPKSSCVLVAKSPQHTVTRYVRYHRYDYNRLKFHSVNSLVLQDETKLIMPLIQVLVSEFEGEDSEDFASHFQ